MKRLMDTFLIPLLDVQVNATWTFPTLISTTDGGRGVERGEERTQVPREKQQSCNIFILLQVSSSPPGQLKPK